MYIYWGMMEASYCDQNLTQWLIIWDIAVNTGEIAGTKCAVCITEGRGRKTTLPLVSRPVKENNFLCRLVKLNILI